LNFKKKFSDWLTNRYQLVIRNQENLAEKSTFTFSYAKLIALGIVIFSIFVACGLALATTILAQWSHPAYMEQENRKKIIQLAAEVATLEQQAIQQKKFITLLQRIIAGQDPSSNEISAANEAQTENMP
jgi:hypothetical protein